MWKINLVISDKLKGRHLKFKISLFKTLASCAHCNDAMVGRDSNTAFPAALTFITAEAKKNATKEGKVYSGTQF